MSIKDRIIEIREMRLGDIAHNPSNWRTHPDKQRDILSSLLTEIGWAGVPLAYRSERTNTLTLLELNSTKHNTGQYVLCNILT